MVVSGRETVRYNFFVWIECVPTMGPPADDRTASHGSYCPNCGSGVEAGDSYCGQCGQDLSESTAGEPNEEEIRQFRRRVGDHVANGWKIQYDGGDEVALVDRGYGSVGIHILLLIFTGGIGNLLYGWYHYEHTATRKVIRANGPDSTPERPTGRAGTTERSPVQESRQSDAESESGSLSGYVWGFLSIIVGVAALSSLGTSAVGITVAFACLALAALLLPPTRSRLENRHPPTTFGPTTSVEERFVSGTDRPCSVCFDRIDEGVKREYEQSYVFAGIPIYTIERGENWYCESCRSESTGVEDALASGSLDAELDAALEESSPADEPETAPDDGALLEDEL